MYLRMLLNKIDCLVALKLYIPPSNSVISGNSSIVTRDLSKLAVAMSELRYDGRVAVVTGAGGG